MKIDRKKNLLVLESFSTLKKSLNFEGSVALGIGCRVAEINAREVVTGKGCIIGKITCDRIFLGAFSTFNSIEANEVTILNHCKGDRVFAREVRIGSMCEICEINADLLEMKGASKLNKITANKIRCMDFI